MNYDSACKILNINNGNPSLNDIKKRYHIMALKYHPDKCNLTDANERFQEIDEAYRYLINNTIKENSINYETNYNDLLYNFIQVHFNNNNLSVSVIKNIINNTFLPYILNNSNSVQLNEIYTFLKEYQDILGVTDDIIIKMNKYINIETVILNPTINDLVNNNIFILNYGNNKFYVPLWHNELYYEDDNKELIKIQCIPDLSDNINIDNENNVHIKINESLNKLFSNKYIKINLGDKLINFDSEQLYLKKCQTTVLKGDGISCIDNNDMFNTTCKSNLILHFNFY